MGEKPKALVTGAGGFIGGHLSEKLMNTGYSVVGVDCLTSYTDVKFKRETLSILEKCDAENGSNNFVFCEENITNESGMRSIFEKHGPFTVVVHLAAQPGVRYSVEKPAEVIHTNVFGTQVMFDCVREFKVPYCVAASSSSVYGHGSVAPFSETQLCAQPISPYAASKRANELFAHCFSHLYKIPVTMLRFFTVYGPRGRPDMAAFKFIDKISKGTPIDKYGDGSAVREFTYITDIVNGIVGAINNAPTGDIPYQTVNLGGGATHTLNNFIATIEKHVGKSAVINQMDMQPGDVALTSADQALAKEKLGFVPEVSLDEGIRKTVEWYNSSVLPS